MADYSALVGPGLAYAGPDQGIDFTGAGDVFTPYAAVVTRVQSSGSGWPGQGAVINLQFLEGPAKGHYLYYAEDLVPAAGVKPGAKLPAGAKVAYATGSGMAPGIEIGWAQPSGIPLAPRPAPRPAPQTTQEGLSFDRFVQAVSGQQKAGSKSGGGSGLVGNIVGSTILGPAGEVAGAVGGISGAINSGARHIPGVAQVEDVGSFLGKLTDPSYILRGLQILAGAGLVGVGAVLLVRQVALAADLPDPAAAAGAAAAARG